MVKKFLVWLIIPFAKGWIWVKWNFPYNLAKLHMAYRKYTETEMYRLRVAEMGYGYALKAFVDNCEERYFLKKLTTGDKLKAFFIPYSFIGTENLYSNDFSRQ